MKQVPAGKFYRILLILILISAVAFGQSASSETELKKQADKAFSAEDYENALSPYSQLLSLYPQNGQYNYRYGVSLLLAGKPKANAVDYLERATKDVANPEEVWIYLAKAYMIIGKFDDAVQVINKFESLANAGKQKKFESSQLKANCYNAIELLRNRKNVAIISSKEVVRNEFYNYYDWSLANGKIVPAAEQFLTTQDKDKQINPVMFIANDKQTIYLSSFGKKGDRGKDIFVIRKQPNGQWSEPENLGETINSVENEDFPYLDRDGRTLYFSSRSSKSIGGYDIFKSKFDFNTGKWSTPENLGWPINTIGDDFLYVPISNGAEAVYATALEASKKELDIRKIQIPDGGEQLVTITGFYAPQDQKVRRDARVTVLRSSGDGIITSVYTDPRTGKYEITLAPGQDYILVIDGGGYLPHAETFTLPSGVDNANLKQVVKINKDKSTEDLTIENYFYPAALASSEKPSSVLSSSISSDVDSTTLMKVQINNETVFVPKPGTGKKEETATAQDPNIINIEKKDGYDPTLASGPSPEEIRQKQEEENRAAEVENEDKKVPRYDVSIDNKELATIAATDAKNTRAEADSLKGEVQKLYAASKERDSLAEDMTAKAAKASEADKNSYLNEAYTLKTDADNMRRQAADMEVAVAALEIEAKNSEQEASALLAAIDDKGTKKTTDKKGTAGTAKSTTPTTVSEPMTAHIPRNDGTQGGAKNDEIKELTPEQTPVATPANEEPSLASTMSKEKSAAENSVANPNTPSTEQTPIVHPPATTNESTTVAKNETPAAENKNATGANNETTGAETADKNTTTGNSPTSPVTISETANVKTETAPQEKANPTAVNHTGSTEQNTNSNQVTTQTEEKPSTGNQIADNTKPATETTTKTDSQSEIIVHKPEESVPSTTEPNPVVTTTSTNTTTPASNTSTTSSENSVESPSTQISPANDSPSIAENSTDKKTETTTAAVKNAVKNNSTTPVTNDGAVKNPEKTGTPANTTTNTTSNTTATVPEHDETVSAYNTETKTESTVKDNQVKPETKTERTNTVEPKQAPTVANEASTTEKATDTNSTTPSTSNQTEPASAENSEKQTKDYVANVPTVQETVENTTDKNVNETPTSPAPKNDDTESKSVQTPSQEAATPITAANETKSETKTAESTTPASTTVPATNSNGISQSANDNTVSTNQVNTGTDTVTSAPTVELKKPFIPPVHEPAPMPENINALKAQPVNEEARIAYQAYKSKYANSLKLSNQSIEMQNRITTTKSSPERDSLIYVSNQLTEQSATMFDEAVAQLKAAQAIDPDVKQKMELNEQITAYNSSIPTNSNRDNSAKLNDQGDATISPAENANQETVSPASTTEVAANTPTTETAAPAPAVDYSELSPEEAAKVAEMTTFSVTTPNGTEEIKIDTAGLNVRHPDFPLYVEANKKITGKQVETIDVFAAAVNQNKLAVQQKQEQNRLMDKAEVEQDRPTKAQIFIQADKMRDSSAYNEKEAEAKFKLAQQHTNEVKNLTSEMEVIRKRIAIPGRTLAASATKSLVKPGELSQEEVLALNPPAEEKAVTRTETSSTPVTNYSPATVQEFAKNSFSIADKPAYSESNPIPMNPPLPEGLVFKVQIGAFRKQIPAEKFEGVQPITAETTRPEWVRYCVGLFQTFEPAVVVKKEMQQRGFKDAFVVAYLNGKRIELSEAYAMVAKNKATPDQSYVQNSKKEMALLRANNIRPENIASIRNNQLDEDEKDFYGQDASKIKSSIATVEYAVQVGVFRSTVVPTGLRTLMPLFTEKIRTNLFRFTTDHYVDYAAADSMRRIARNEGVKDAFIVVYRNGVQSALSSVPLAERKVRITSTSNQIATTNSAASQNQDVTRNNSTSVATATGDEKVTYKVQLGAFKNNIPFSSVVSFLSVADKGITELTDDRGLHIFYAGNVSSYSAAVAMRDEIVQKGVTDAFVVALKNGKRVVITEEMKGGN